LKISFCADAFVRYAEVSISADVDCRFQNPLIDSVEQYHDCRTEEKPLRDIVWIRCSFTYDGSKDNEWGRNCFLL